MGRLTIGREGSLFYTQTAQYQVETRDPYKIPTPPEIVHIQFYDIVKVTIQDGNIEYTLEKEIDHSPLMFIRGEKMHIMNIKNAFPDGSGLLHPEVVIKQMENQGLTSAIIFNGQGYGFDKTRLFIKDYVRRTRNGQAPEGTSPDSNDQRTKNISQKETPGPVRKTTEPSKINGRSTSRRKKKRTSSGRKRGRR